jgi:hypothetical protein
MPQGKIQPSNAILESGTPLVQEYEAGTVTHLAPGRLVITETNDYTCTVATAAALTVLGVADVPSDEKLSSMQANETVSGAPTKTFTAGDPVRVLRGDIVVKLLLKSGEDVDVGERIEAAANGMCQAYTTALADVGYALEDTGGATTTCDWILVKLTI